ncbi:MAG: DUF1566 domain-containing protein [Desulfobacteraceae bacterium]|nr:DUF1566 domain-containing protein [Desulfobacteraceae bacterium]
MAKITIRSFPFLIFILFITASCAFAQTKDYGSYDPDLGKALQRMGKKYALVIGVDYPPPHTLDWTVRDAKMIAKTLQDVYGFETTLVTGNKETTRQGITKAFSRLKKRNYKTSDQVVVFFSGHGIHDPVSREVGYLVPRDGKRDDLFGTCISMSLLHDLSKTLRARHVLFIIDSCYSGIIGGFSFMSFNRELRIKSYLGMRARQVLTAGRSEEEARMSPSKQMSVYSFYLHRALNSEGGYLRADSDADHIITVRELQEYLAGKVTDDTYGHQNPRIFNFTANDGQFVFVPKYLTENRWQKKQKELEKEYQRIRTETRKAETYAKELEAKRKAEELERQIAEEKKKAEKWRNQAQKERRTDQVAVVDQRTISPLYKLRRRPSDLSEADVKTMLAKYNFYEREWNKSGDFKNDFVKGRNGKTVIDRKTGLMWQQSGSDNYMVYKKTKAYIEKLNRDKFAGYSDWRLPTIEELASLIESKELNGDLHIDPVFDKKQRLCWSSDKRSSGSAWYYAHFDLGDVHWTDFSISLYVRGVRSRTSR